MPEPSVRPGIGAIPYPGGVTFRVWAPFASDVSVIGDFTDWELNPIPLVRESNGYWSTDVDGAFAGQQYRFIVGGNERIDPRAKHVTHSVGNGIIYNSDYRWRVHDFVIPPWNEMVVYEMHVGTFPDDLVPPVRAFEAIEDDLWYLKKLGVNVIEILPTSEFPLDSSWGYNPSHIFAVESAYGGPDALKFFVDTAHDHGIAVVLDVVYNHFGPDDLSIWQFDGWFQYWNGDDMGGIYFYNDWRANTPWGHKNRPDYGREEVRAFIRDNALQWLEEYRIDGLRFDATSYIRNVNGRDGDPIDHPSNLDGWGWNLLRWINDEVDRLQPWKIVIAEDLQRNSWITRPTSVGGAGFDTQWDAEFVHPVRRVLTTARDNDRDMQAVRAAIENRFDGDPFKRVIYTKSHDEVARANGKRRLTMDIDSVQPDSWKARKLSTLGAALVLTSPGIPMIFQGQEILESIPFGDEHLMDWDKYDRYRGIFMLYRDLIDLRRNRYRNTRGLCGPHVNVFHVNPYDKVVAFHRWENGGPGDDVIAVMNFSQRALDAYTIGLPRPGLWYCRFNSDWKGYDSLFSDHPTHHTVAQYASYDGLVYSADIGIGPYSAVIFSQ